tara:strand:- start:207 stop:542 length:336 start_codon:yes stop_codon:yes gene_type:complete
MKESKEKRNGDGIDDEGGEGIEEGGLLLPCVKHVEECVYTWNEDENENSSGASGERGRMDIAIDPPLRVPCSDIWHDITLPSSSRKKSRNSYFTMNFVKVVKCLVKPYDSS